jgi:hypothetical protein
MSIMVYKVGSMPMLTEGKFTYDRQLTIIERTPQNECIVIKKEGYDGKCP